LMYRLDITSIKAIMRYFENSIQLKDCKDKNRFLHSNSEVF
jgi:hypothetical protein